MKILILPSARDDLADGFDFYERQAKGLEIIFRSRFSRMLNHCCSTQEII